eukprot:TRINITY_DN38616_c0_g1_i1.p1 TRINITY_DN38616_c0_g1~~TRINITY_DN38616_c0_g1_i1.p1  ORF type:complete len:238 (-),score=72.14 TRINITY_DN38616_c0_g1_i1:25-738(-)
MSPHEDGEVQVAVGDTGEAANPGAASPPPKKRTGRTRAMLREALQEAEDQLRKAREAFATGSGDGAAALAADAEAALRNVEAKVDGLRSARQLSPVPEGEAAGRRRGGHGAAEVSAAADVATAAFVKAATEAAADDDASVIWDGGTPAAARSFQPLDAQPMQGAPVSPSSPASKAEVMRSLQMAETQLGAMQAKALGPGGLVDAAGARAEAARLQEMLAAVEQQVKQLTMLRAARGN